MLVGDTIVTFAEKNAATSNFCGFSWLLQRSAQVMKCAVLVEIAANFYILCKYFFAINMIQQHQNTYLYHQVLYNTEAKNI